MDFTAAMASLRETFPQHSPSTIERVLRENRGILDAAASELLTIPATSRPPSRPPAGAPAAPVPAPARKPPPARAPAAPPRAPPVDHIFPPDFLRFPADIAWVRVTTRANSSPLQTDDDVLGDRGGRGAIPDAAMQTVENGTADARGQASGWSKLKSKLMGQSQTYAPL
jgi:hypothetical protein